MHLCILFRACLFRCFYLYHQLIDLYPEMENSTCYGWGKSGDEDQFIKHIQVIAKPLAT